MRDTQREREREAGRDRQREKQAPCREPDAGLDPGSPGSCPGLKAGAKPLSHPGIPRFYYVKENKRACKISSLIEFRSHFAHPRLKF